MTQVLDGRSAEEISQSHPLLEWYGRMAARGVSVHGHDIVLDPSLSARFAVGVEDDGMLMLGVMVEDAPHLLSVKWDKANMVRQFKGHDWIVLNGSVGSDAPLRFFIPMADVVSTRFEGYDASKLRIRRMRMLKGKPVAAKEPQAELDLVMKGYR